MIDDKKSEQEEKENHIEKVKEKYAEYQKKYSLPEFSELNKEFGIEKSEVETEFFLKEIVKGIADKFQNYLRFLENLINPANSSMFAFSLVKVIDNGNRQKLSEAYRKISEFEIKLIKLDLKSSEISEAEFIKSSYKLWTEIREDLFEIINKAEENFSKIQNTEEGKRNYFG